MPASENAGNALLVFLALAWLLSGSAEQPEKRDITKSPTRRKRKR